MKKKVFIISMIVIVIGAIIAAILGFNVDLRYRAHKSILVPIGTSYSVSDVKSIAEDIFGKGKVTIEKSGLYEDEAIINVKESSDDQIASLKNKINEKYNVTQKLLVSIGKEDYNVDDVKAIAKEVFGKDEVNVEKYKDDEKYVSIEANLLIEKDIENLNTKINEKYELTNEAKSISSTNVIKENEIPRVRLTDMAKQYILYTFIATIVIVVYLSVRFKKLGLKKIFVRTAATIIFGELFYIAVVSICRLPINKVVVLAAFAIYLAILTYLNYKYTIELESSKK